MRKIIVLTALMSALCFGQTQKLSIPKELQGTIPSFAVYSINNTDKLDQDDFKSKAKKAGARRIVFSFFQTTCVNCREEFALLRRNASELKSNGVLVYLIDVGEDPDKMGDEARDFVKKFAGDSFPLYFDQYGNLLKKSGLADKSKDGKDVFVFPRSIVMDRDLRVLGVLSAVSEEDFPQILWSEL
jgi:thiol-disulfide isomerase/thioredoxin